jgi:hypothetical protein
MQNYVIRLIRKDSYLHKHFDIILMMNRVQVMSLFLAYYVESLNVVKQD